MEANDPAEEGSKENEQTEIEQTQDDHKVQETTEPGEEPSKEEHQEEPNPEETSEPKEEPSKEQTQEEHNPVKAPEPKEDPPKEPPQEEHNPEETSDPKEDPPEEEPKPEETTEIKEGTPKEETQEEEEEEDPEEHKEKPQEEQKVEETTEHKEEPPKDEAQEPPKVEEAKEEAKEEPKPEENPEQKEEPPKEEPQEQPKAEEPPKEEPTQQPKPEDTPQTKEEPPKEELTEQTKPEEIPQTNEEPPKEDIKELPKVEDIIEAKQEPPKEETHEPPKEEVHEPPKEEVHEPPKEEVHEPPKEEVHEPPKEEVHEPPKEEVHEPPKEEVHEPPKEEVHEPPKEEVHEPPKEEVHEPPKEEVHEPPKEEVHEPPKEEVHEPPKEEAHEPPKEEVHEPPKEEIKEEPKPSAPPKVLEASTAVPVKPIVSQEKVAKEGKGEPNDNSKKVSEMLSNAQPQNLSFQPSTAKAKLEIPQKQMIDVFKAETDEEDSKNIILTPTKEISFISLGLLTEKILSEPKGSFHGLNNEEVIKYFLYQKTALISTEVFLDLLHYFIEKKREDVLIRVLNQYIVDNFEVEISKDKPLKETIVQLYSQIPEEKEVIFYNNKVKIKEIVTLLKSNDNAKIAIKLNEMAGQEMLKYSTAPPVPEIPEIIGEKFDIFAWSPREIARQMSLMTQYLFKQIHMKEILNSLWTKIDKMRFSPHVTKLINRFNQISFWMCEEILSYDHARGRAKAIEKFIDIAEELKNLRNFNDCFNIITSFNYFPVKRLEKSWGKVSNESLAKLKELSGLCSLDQNWGNLRNEYQKYKSLKDQERATGCVPYLGYFLKDLAFIDEGGKYLNGEKLIYIEKLKKCGKVIDELKFFQRFGYNFKPVFGLAFLSQPEPLGEDQLLDLSKKLEPNFILTKTKQKTKRISNTDIKCSPGKNVFGEIFKEFIHKTSEAETKKISLKEKLAMLKKNRK